MNVLSILLKVSIILPYREHIIEFQLAETPFIQKDRTTHQRTMIDSTSAANGHVSGVNDNEGSSSFTIKAGLAKMLKGGVIMDVVNAEQVYYEHSLTS